MITDMGRIGDQALDIAEIVETGTILETDGGELLGKMAEATMEMVSRSIEACVEQNLEKAQEVIQSDDVVDELFVR